MCQRIVEHVGENLLFARENVVLLLPTESIGITVWTLCQTVPVPVGHFLASGAGLSSSANQVLIV